MTGTRTDRDTEDRFSSGEGGILHEDNNSLQSLAQAADLVLKKGFWRLRFPVELEAHYLARVPKINMAKHRLFIILGIFFVAALGLIDPFFAHDALSAAWVIRFGLLVPLLFSQLALSYFFEQNYQKIENLLNWTLLTIAALGTFYVMRTANSEVSNHYHGMLMLVILYGNLLTRFRFWSALAWSICFVIAYIATIGINGFASPVVSYYAFLICMVCFVTLLANYQVDYNTRSDYLNSLLLQAEKEKLETVRKDLYQVAVVDSLTGLYNRRHFDETLASAWRHSYDKQAPISLLFIDVDCFKRFNDTYGHQRGDQCLKVVADTLQTLERRPTDVVARYGGEEFVIILPGMNNTMACNFAENIRQTVYSLRIPHRASTVSDTVTVSIGVATMVPGPANHYRLLIEYADKALYEAKHEGRNRVCNRVDKHPIIDTAEPVEEF